MKKKILSMLVLLTILVSGLAFTVYAEGELPILTVDLTEFKITDNRFWNGYYVGYTTDIKDVVSAAENNSGFKVQVPSTGGGKIEFTVEVENAGVYELWQRDSFYRGCVSIAIDGSSINNNYTRQDNTTIYVPAEDLKYKKVGSKFLEKGTHKIKYNFWSTGQDEWDYYIFNAELRCTELKAEPAATVSTADGKADILANYDDRVTTGTAIGAVYDSSDRLIGVGTYKMGTETELHTVAVDLSSQYTEVKNGWWFGAPSYKTNYTGNTCVKENDGCGLKIAIPPASTGGGGTFYYEFEVEKAGTYRFYQKDCFAYGSVSIKVDNISLNSNYFQPQGKFYWDSGIQYNAVGSEVYLTKGTHKLQYNFWGISEDINAEISKNGTYEYWLLGAEFRCTSLDNSIAYLEDIEYAGTPAKIKVMHWDSLDALKPVEKMLTFKSEDAGTTWVQQ